MTYPIPRATSTPIRRPPLRMIFSFSGLDWLLTCEKPVAFRVALDQRRHHAIWVPDEPDARPFLREIRLGMRKERNAAAAILLQHQSSVLQRHDRHAARPIVCPDLLLENV